MDFIYTPGDVVTVEVETDTNGHVALEGDAVELVGENNRLPVVEETSEKAADIGVLASDPEDFTAQSDHSAGDNVGKADLIIAKHVIPVTADSGYTPSIGDYVTAGDGGDFEQVTGPTATGLGGAVTNNLGVDGNGNLETDNGSDIELDITDGIPTGVVFDPNPANFGPGDMAIALVR